MRAGTLTSRLEAIAATCPDVSWGMHIRSAATGEPRGDYCSDVALSTASVGKILLLVEAARLIDSGELPPEELLERRRVPPVADSGLWQHLTVAALPVHDVCALVGALSDNLATNVLLDRIGLERVQALTGQMDLRHTSLHDQVRDVRGPELPERLSSASACELTRIFTAVHRGTLVTPSVSARVRDWLSIDADLSMAASVFNLDPLSHEAPDRGIDIVHKTGTDAGVRVDCGLVVGPDGAIAYAAIANWDPALDRRDAVHAAMRMFGDEMIPLVRSAD